MDGVAEPRAEASYWLTITFSQTLGLADARHSAGRLGGDSGPGYAAGALIFGALLGVLVVLTTTTSISRVALFWAFILTRPLAATVGDFLDKPIAKGRLEFSRPLARPCWP